MFTYLLHNPVWNETREVSRQYAIECMKCWWWDFKYISVKELQNHKGYTYNKLP